MKEKPEWQSVELEQVEWLYDGVFGHREAVNLREDGRLEREFELPNFSGEETRKTGPLTAVLPPAEEWIWGLDGVPLNPMRLLNEKGGVRDSQIMEKLPREMRGTDVQYMFGDYKLAEDRTEEERHQFWIDPRKVEQATHVLLQVHYDFNVVPVIPQDVSVALSQRDICWAAAIDNTKVWFYRTDYRYDWEEEWTDGKIGTRWYVYEVNERLKAARKYCAESWKAQIEAGEKAFRDFLSARDDYRVKLWKLAVEIPKNYEVKLDGKGDGQFLDVSYWRNNLGSGGAGRSLIHHFFRYDAVGLAELEEFLVRYCKA